MKKKFFNKINVDGYNMEEYVLRKLKEEKPKRVLASLKASCLFQFSNYLENIVNKCFDKIHFAGYNMRGYTIEKFENLKI